MISSAPFDDWNAFEKADPERASRVLRDAARRLAGDDSDDAAGQQEWVKRTFLQLPDGEVKELPVGHRQHEVRPLAGVLRCDRQVIRPEDADARQVLGVADRYEAEGVAAA